MNEAETIRQTIKAHSEKHEKSISQLSLDVGLTRSYVYNAMQKTPYLAALAVAKVVEFPSGILEWAEQEKIAVRERWLASRKPARPVDEIRVFPIAWQRWARA